VTYAVTYAKSCSDLYVDRKYKNESEVRDTSWIVKPDDLCKRQKSEQTISMMALSTVCHEYKFICRMVWPYLREKKHFICFIVL